MKAIQIRTTGGPEVLEFVDLPTPLLEESQQWRLLTTG